MRMQAMDTFTSVHQDCLWAHTALDVCSLRSQNPCSKPFPDPVNPSHVGMWESHQAFTYSLCTHLHKRRRRQL